MVHNTNKGRALKNRGVPRPHTRKPRPHLWRVGPDPVLHDKYRVWLQQRNQAQWRGEGWHIPFEAWVKIWGDLWELRGRTRGTYCMTRCDWTESWTTDNVRIATREEHAKMQGAAVRAGIVSAAQQRRRAKLGI